MKHFLLLSLMSAPLFAADDQQTAQKAISSIGIKFGSHQLIEDTITVPGVAKQYAPVACMNTLKPGRSMVSWAPGIAGGEKRACDPRSPHVTPEQTRELYRWYIGFISGNDEKLTAKIATTINKSPIDHKEWGNCLDEALLLRAKRKTVQKDVTQIAAATTLMLKLFRFEATDDNQIVKRFNPLYGFSLDRKYLTPNDVLNISSADTYAAEDAAYQNCPIIVPPNLMYLLFDLQQCDLSNNSHDEQVNFLKEYAASLCEQSDVTHEAPIMILKEK